MVLFVFILYFFTLDNSPATFDTPGVNRPYTPSTEQTQSAQHTLDKNEDKPKDIIDNHTLGK